LILLLALLTAAAPARARHLRPEENPRLGGSAKAFTRARVAFDEPKDRAETSGDVPVRLRIAGYDFVGGAHAHLIVDNLPAFQVNDAAAPLVVRGLAPGPHLLRVVLCRPWHEVVKARHAFAMVRFWSGPRPARREAAKQEKAAWPDPRRPLLTYVFPIGEPPAGITVETGSPDRPATPEPAAPKAETATTSVAPVSVGEDFSSYVPAPRAAAPAFPPPPPPKPEVTPAPAAIRPRPIALDFFLSNAHLGRGRHGSKVRVVLDKKELQLVNAWHPRPLGRLRPGVHHISIDLLDRLALKVPGPLNRTDRRFTTP
jgi:hypothetical protein